MSRDEAADIRKLSDGSHDGATAMEFLAQFASSQQEGVNASSAG